MLSLAKRVLSVPALFDSYQSLIGAPRCHERFIIEMLNPAPGTRVLDIGCGVGASVGYVPPSVRYTGIDISEAYIEEARKRYGVRGDFHCLSVSDADAAKLGRFENIFAFGVLHHLPDETIRETVELVRRVAVRGARFVTIDPCYVPGQHWLARLLIKNDRGQHVRDVEGFRRLLSPLGDVESVVHHDLLRVPYTQLVMSVRVL